MAHRCEFCGAKPAFQRGTGDLNAAHTCNDCDRRARGECSHYDGNEDGECDHCGENLDSNLKGH